MPADPTPAPQEPLAEALGASEVRHYGSHDEAVRAEMARRAPQEPVGDARAPLPCVCGELESAKAALAAEKAAHAETRAAMEDARLWGFYAAYHWYEDLIEWLGDDHDEENCDGPQELIWEVKVRCEGLVAERMALATKLAAAAAARDQALAERDRLREALKQCEEEASQAVGMCYGNLVHVLRRARATLATTPAEHVEPTWNPKDVPISDQEITEFAQEQREWFDIGPDLLDVGPTPDFCLRLVATIRDLQRRLDLAEHVKERGG